MQNEYFTSRCQTAISKANNTQANKYIDESLDQYVNEVKDSKIENNEP